MKKYYYKSSKQKGFTLIELLVVIAIISLLSSVLLASFNTVRLKTRNAKRAMDMQNIYTALSMYYIQYGCLPYTSGTGCPGAGGYSESNSGGWDSSYEGGFLTFLQTAGIMNQVPVDPINNETYHYKYYCYTWNDINGLHLGYQNEDGGYVMKNIGGWADPSFTCK